MSINKREEAGGAPIAERFSRDDIIQLLKADGMERERLFERADKVREGGVGNDVHLRGIVEFSNYCIKNCLYCGLRRDNSKLKRYRMTEAEILETARSGVEAGLRTIVLQSGEDPFFTADFLARIIGEMKEKHDIAVTVSVGDRAKKDYRAIIKAGADRYLLKHETADQEIFARLRPGTTLEGRKKRLFWLKELGFQVGSGNMIGLPGQSIGTLADDILLMQELDVEMAGIGPFIPNGDTPLAGCETGSVDMTLKTLAVARLALPFTHLPATTALASIHPRGRERALRCGANVVMPDITPGKYKRLYEIYPNKAYITDDGALQSVPRILGLIESAGRSVARDYGDSRKPGFGQLQSGKEGMASNG
jgi:biotin synthase